MWRTIHSRDVFPFASTYGMRLKTMGHFNIGHKRGQYYIGARIGYCSYGGLCTWCYITVDNVAVHNAQQAIVQFYFIIHDIASMDLFSRLKIVQKKVNRCLFLFYKVLKFCYQQMPISEPFMKYVSLKKNDTDMGLLIQVFGYT